MSKSTNATGASIEIDNSLGLRIATFDADGKSIDLGLKLSRIEAQRIAGALLDYSDEVCRRSEKSVTFMAAHRANPETKGVARLHSSSVPASRARDPFGDVR